MNIDTLREEIGFPDHIRALFRKARMAYCRMKTRRRIVAFLLAFVFIGVSGVNLGSAQPSSSRRPQRIVSLSPVVTESLYLLGLDKEIVGVTIYCNRPPQVQSKTKVGSVMEADVEKIVGLKPDLLVAMTLTNKKDIEKLEQLGIKTIVLDIPRNFSELCELFLRLGKMTATEDRAIKIVGEARKTTIEIKARCEKLPKPKVLVQIGAKPFFVVAKDSFINDYIEFAGGTNIFRSAPSGSVSREEVLRRNPDVIMVSSMGISGEEERKAWRRFASITAVKQDRIYIVDPDKLCSPTPVSFTESLREIARILHTRRHHE